MHKYVSIVFTTVTICSLFGCKMGTVQSELEKTRKTMIDVANTLSNAVPGEELRKLQMQAISEDKAVADKAKATIARLYGIDQSEYQTNYVITIRVETPGKDLGTSGLKPIRIGIAQMATNLQGSAELAITSDRVNLQELGASSWHSPSQVELENKVHSAVAAASKTLLGSPNQLPPGKGALIAPYKFPNGLVSLPHPILDIDRPSDQHFTSLKDTNKIFARYNAELSTAILTAFSRVEIPISAPSYSEPWRFEKGPYLGVYIDSASWQTYGGRLEVSYLLHKAGDQNTTFRNVGWRKIPAGRFSAHDGADMLLKADRMSPDPNGKMQVRWGTANVLGDDYTPAYRDELRAQMDIYKTVASGQTKDAPWWQFWK